MYVVGISGMGEGSQKMDNSSDKVDNSPFLDLVAIYLLFKAFISKNFNFYLTDF